MGGRTPFMNPLLSLNTISLGGGSETFASAKRQVSFTGHIPQVTVTGL